MPLGRFGASWTLLKTQGKVYGFLFCELKPFHDSAIIQEYSRRIILAMVTFIADWFGEIMRGKLPVLFHVIWMKNHSAVFKHYFAFWSSSCEQNIVLFSWSLFHGA